MKSPSTRYQILHTPDPGALFCWVLALDHHDHDRDHDDDDHDQDDDDYVVTTQ